VSSTDPSGVGAPGGPAIARITTVPPARRRGTVGSADAKRRLGRAARIALLVFVGIILYGPLLILAIFSFNNSIIIALPFEGFTTKW